MNFDSSQHPQTTSAVAVLARPISGIVIEKYFLFSPQNLPENKGRPLFYTQEENTF